MYQGRHADFLRQRPKKDPKLVYTQLHGETGFHRRKKKRRESSLKGKKR